jgi:hypothetical protein
MREKRKMIAIYKNNTGFEIPKGSIVVVDSKNKYIKSLEPPNWKKLLDACGFKPCHMCYLNKQAYRYTYE